MKQHDFNQIIKMEDWNQDLYWNIVENPHVYSTYFIKSSGLPFMLEQQEKGVFVAPIINLYTELLNK